MKKVIIGLLSTFMLVNTAIAGDNLFEKLFDQSYTIKTQSIEVSKPENTSDELIDLVDKNFEKIKSNLSKYSVDKRIEVYTSSVKKLNKLILTRKSKKDIEVLTYLRNLINKEIETLKTERGLLTELFGDKTNKICNNGYILNNGECIKKEPIVENITNVAKKTCYVSNGYGNQFWYDTYRSKCYVTNCNDGYILKDGYCEKTNYYYNNGYYYNGNNYYNGYYYNCSSNEHFEDGRCISNSKYCSVDNGYGKQTWNGNYWSSCYAESCNSGFYLSNGYCIKNYYNNYNCSNSEHYEDGRCVYNSKYCSVDNGYGKQTWNGNYWSSCYAESCNSGYYLSNGNCIRDNYYKNCSYDQHFENGYCVFNSRNCDVNNGTGKQYWTGNSWSSCYAIACYSGYYLSSNGYCYK